MVMVLPAPGQPGEFPAPIESTDYLIRYLAVIPIVRGRKVYAVNITEGGFGLQASCALWQSDESSADGWASSRLSTKAGVFHRSTGPGATPLN